jgi:hypothetical protein
MATYIPFHTWKRTTNNPGAEPCDWWQEHLLPLCSAGALVGKRMLLYLRFQHPWALRRMAHDYPDTIRFSVEAIPPHARVDYCRRCCESPT